MTRFVFYHSVKHDGSWYQAGSYYYLDDEQAAAMAGFCVREGEPIPEPEELAPAEVRRRERERTASVERAKRAEEEIHRAIMSERRTTLRRIDALDAEVAKAVDDFERDLEGGSDA